KSCRRVMAISNIWGVVEPSSGSLTSTSLELLSHARSLSASVAAITWASDGASFAPEAGEFGATTLYNVGDLHGALPGAPIASSIEALIASVGAPDAVLLPNSYDGRDIAGRLSARLDRPVLTNVTGLLDEGGLVTEHPIFGGTQTVRARFTGDGPGIIVVRAKSFVVNATEGLAASVVDAPAGDT